MPSMSSLAWVIDISQLNVLHLENGTSQVRNFQYSFSVCLYHLLFLICRIQLCDYAAQVNSGCGINFKALVRVHVTSALRCSVPVRIS